MYILQFKITLLSNAQIKKGEKKQALHFWIKIKIGHTVGEPWLYR